MKYGIVTDTHLGCRGGSRVFREYQSWWWKNKFFPDMEARGINEVIHAGDFFDNRNSLTLHDIEFTINEFAPLLKKYDIHMYIIVGNHDIAFRNTNRVHSLSVLKAAAPDHVTIVEDDVKVVGPFILVPWLNNENHEKILKQMQDRKDDSRIVVGHFEINGMKMYANSIMCEGGLDPDLFKGFHKVLSGHFHHPNVYQNIEYIGSPFEITWQDYNDWRGHMVYDHVTGDFERVLNEHQLFNKITYEDIKDKDDDELRQAVEGQFVVMSINEEYKKVRVKDFIAKLESFKPLSLDITDNTVVSSGVSSQASQTQQADLKDMTHYITSYVEDRPDEFNKDDVLPVLNSLHSEAMDNMKDSE